MNQPSRIPTLERDFLLPSEFPLELGGVLQNARLHYALYGEINPARSNLILVCHALSGSALVAEWWPAVWAMPGLVDPQQDAILGINILGSCSGTTGPASLNPATGAPYGPAFPQVTIRDTVRAQALLLDHLGVSCLKLAIGASIGGMQSIEWAILFPARVRKVIAIATAPLNAMALALNHLQRQAIQLDPAWNGGLYSPDNPPRRGLALARGLAVASYKSSPLFDQRFRRNPDRSGEDPLTGGRFDIAGYLDYQGDRFNQRFDANTYLTITRLMDLFDPTRGFATPADAWTRILAEILLVGISSDWLFPPADIAALAAGMRAAGAPCSYRELVSDHGHDAFLAEPRQLIEILTS